VDSQDNCRNVANPGQEDRDSDRIGDACDNDNDNDSVPDTSDNCPELANADQKDSDRDGIGNACNPSPAPLSLSGNGDDNHTLIDTKYKEYTAINFFVS
jgi:hypothetical protein